MSYSSAKQRWQPSVIKLRGELELPDKILTSSFCALMLTVNIVFLTPNGDDLYFAAAPNSLWDFTVQRLQGWSSRTLIEVCLYVFTKAPLILFKIVNAIMACTFPYLVARLVSGSQATSSAIFPTVCLMFMYPFLDLGTAGWQTTIINQFWPAFAAVYAGLVLQKQMQGERISLYSQTAGLFAMLFACNIEQLCVYILALLLLVFWYKRGRVCALFWGYTAIGLTSFGYALVVPGNFARLASETSTWMPTFAHLSVTQKILSGYASTVFHLMASMSYIYNALAGLILIHILSRFSHPMYWLLGMLPLTTLFFPALSLPHAYAEIQYIPQESLGQYVALSISIISLFSLALCVLLIVPKLRNAIFILGVLGAGLAQRIMLGFSPTLYASSTRTFVFLYIGIACTLIWIYFQLERELPQAVRPLQRLFLMTMALLSLVNANAPVLFKWLTYV